FLLLSQLTYIVLAKPVSSDENTESLVEIEKQKLIKFPEEFVAEKAVELDSIFTTSRTTKATATPTPTTTTTANKINTSETKRILDEIEKINQALGYIKKAEPSKVPILLDSSQYLFSNVQNFPTKTTNGATLFFPSIRAIKSQISYNGSNQYSKPSQREVLETSAKIKSNEFIKEVSRNPEKNILQSPPTPSLIYFKPYPFELKQTQALQTPKTHFVIPVKLYKQSSRQQLLENISAKDYQLKGYKIIGDFQNFYNKTNNNVVPIKTKSATKYHLLLVPQALLMEQQARTADKNFKAIEEQNNKLGANAGREEKVKKNSHKAQTQALVDAYNTQNVSRRTDLKTQSTQLNSISNLTKVSTLSPFVTTVMPPISQQNLHRTQFANKTGSNTVKTAFQHIFKFPFRPEARPQQQQQQQQQQVAVPLKIPQKLQYTSLAAANPLVSGSLNNQPQEESDLHYTDYRWEDENTNDCDRSSANDSSDDDESHEMSENKFLAHHHHHHAQKHEVQKEALKQAGIVIQKLKVRKGGVAIAGPGGVATAGSGGTAIVGPGGYALTHPRSLTIAGPGAKVIAIPSNIDLKDALRRTNLFNQTWPREGRIVATGPTVYYAPPTAIGKMANK
uniref:DUF4774 domain-containing protein n=1 Tax=Glossina palpalis gambiensis TaxID=67801 RepID=A0A1B0B975_9MUSC